MDLDIGCRRRMDSLIQGDWEVILPLTKPVSKLDASARKADIRSVFRMI